MPLPMDSSHGNTSTCPTDPPTTLPTTTPGQQSTSTPPPSAAVTQPLSTALELALDKLDRSTHAHRLEMQDKMMAGKGTGELYARHLKRYSEFWATTNETRVAQSPPEIAIPPHPITAAKVAEFLSFEATRNKVGSLVSSRLVL